jgi:hypothetical protein
MLHILFAHARLASDLGHIPLAIHSQQSTQIVQTIFTRIAGGGAHPSPEQLPHSDQSLFHFFDFVQWNTPPGDSFPLFLLKFIRLFLPHSRSILECDIVELFTLCREG